MSVAIPDGPGAVAPGRHDDAEQRLERPPVGVTQAIHLINTVIAPNTATVTASSLMKVAR